MSSSNDVENIASAARAMSHETDVSQTLQRAVESAVELIDGCDHAGVTVVHPDGSMTTEAATDDVVRRGDALQYELNDGPCVQAIREHETVYSGDLTGESRWPQWAERVSVELGVRSMLSLQLFVVDGSIGGLNLYSTGPGGFDAEDRHTALALAAHVAVALTAAQEKVNFESALATRAMIGQAQGRLMERYSLTSEQAFAAMKRISQHRNVKLRVIAQDIALHGIGDRLE